MSYIDYKVTTWNRVHFSSDADINTIIDVLNEEGIDGVFDETLGFIEQETNLIGVEELLSVEDNDGEATVELYDDNGNEVWSNNKIYEN